MAESRTDTPRAASFKEAVCADVQRVYDSCSDKDYISELCVNFTEEDQALVDSAVGVRGNSVDLLDLFVEVEPIPFNRGYYSVEMIGFLLANLSVYSNQFAPPAAVSGIAVFSKKVILYGSESEAAAVLPESISCRLGGSVAQSQPEKFVLITVGTFSIVKLERPVQMLLPACDFCIQDSECLTSSEDPCERFEKLNFPTGDFFPPKLTDLDSCSEQ